MEPFEKNREIYLDHHNFAQPASYAISAMSKEIPFGEVHAPHAKGAEVRAFLKEHAGAICDLLSPSLNHDLFFYNSYSEMIFKLHTRYRMQEAKWEGKNHIFFWNYEEPSVLSDCICQNVPQKEGLADLEKLAREITPKTGMISLPHADPITGIIQPIEELAYLCKEHEILLHLDGSFTAGKIPISLQEYPEICFTLSTNQLHTPVESGILFFPKDRSADFLESEISLPLLSAANVAAKHAELYMDKLTLETAHLRMELEKGVEKCGSSPLRSHFRLPNVSLLLFPYLHQEMLAYRLHKRKLFGAIRYKEEEIERFLRSFSGIEENRYSAISFVLSRFTTKEMIQAATEILKEEVAFLQEKTKRAFHVGSI